MSDDPHKVGKPDRDRINSHEDYEVRRVAEKHGVSPQVVISAINTVGNMRRDVEAYLQKISPRR